MRRRAREGRGLPDAVARRFRRRPTTRLREMGALRRVSPFVDGRAAMPRSRRTGRGALGRRGAPRDGCRVPGRRRAGGQLLAPLRSHRPAGWSAPAKPSTAPTTGFHQPQQLADIAGLLPRLRPQPAVGRPTRALDHIACECEFMDFLNRKQARASGDGLDGRRDDGDAGGDARRPSARSCATTSGASAARLPRGSRPRTATATSARSGRLLLAFLDAECARVGVEAGPVDLDRPARERSTTRRWCAARPRS